MASVADRVKETSTTTGTGNFTLAGAATGFQSFDDAFATSEAIYYTIVNSNGEWEVGQGHLSDSTTLVRDTVLSSSNSGAAVDFAAGTKDVFCSLPASAFRGFDYILIHDEQTQNTAGGSATAGSWEKRTLNVEVTDTGGHASISSSVLTLAAGTYRARISAPAYAVNSHQARFQNTSDNVTTILGTTERTAAAAGVITRSMMEGRFTILAAKNFEVQHRVGTSQATNGYGWPANLSTEVYTVVELWREK